MEQLQPGDPERVGPYTLLGRLGAGGMGAVYLGRSAAGRTVAVKVVIADLARDEGFRARFRAEVAAARSVAGAFTAPVVDADPDAATPWMATAFVPGVPLSAAVAAHGPLPEPAVGTLAAGIAEALLSVHAAGLVHRDLKPGNVLLAADGPHVIDFGIARAVDGAAGFTAAGTIVGSPTFMSPEQALGRQVTTAGDVFALGGTLVYAATGRAPFGSGPTQELLARVAYGEPELGGVPLPLLEMVRACFAKDPGMRPTPRQIVEFVERTVPAAAGGAWLPVAVLADVDAAAAVITGGGVAGVDGGGAGGSEAVTAVTPAYPSTAPTPAYPSTAPTPAYPSTAPTPAYASTAPTPLPGLQDAGPAGSAAPIDPAAPSRRKLLLALAGGAAVAAAGGGAAVALSGGKSDPKPGPVAQPTRTSTPSDLTTAESPGVPSKTTSSAANGVTKKWAPAGSLPAPTGKAGVLDGPAAQPLWTHPVGGSMDDVGAFGYADGLVVIGQGSGTGVYAVDQAGGRAWQNKDLLGSSGSGVGAAADGVVFLAVDDTKFDVHSLINIAAIESTTGKVRWSVPLPAKEWSNATVQGLLGGALFVSGDLESFKDKFLWAIDPGTGRTLWTKTGPEYKNVLIPTIGDQIMVIGGTTGSKQWTIYALSVKNGTQNWKRHLEGGADFALDRPAQVAYAADRYVFIDAAPDGGFFGAYPTSAEEAWEIKLSENGGPADILGAVLTAPGTDTILGVGKRGVHAANAKTHKMLWSAMLPATSTETFENFVTSPLQIADGHAYALTRTGTLYAVDIATGRVRWKYSDPTFTDAMQSLWMAVPGGVVLATGQAVTALPTAGV